MKEIKDFVDMIEEVYITDKNYLAQSPKNDYTSGLCRRSGSIVHSKQYKVLKTLLDKPKMEVTEEMEMLLAENLQAMQSNRPYKAAPQAVFDHISNYSEKPNSSVIANYIMKGLHNAPNELEEKQGLWIEWDSIEWDSPEFTKGLTKLFAKAAEKPKKQTLMNLASRRTNYISLSEDTKFLIKLMDEYLEQNT